MATQKTPVFTLTITMATEDTNMLIIEFKEALEEMANSLDQEGMLDPGEKVEFAAVRAESVTFSRSK